MKRILKIFGIFIIAFVCMKVNAAEYDMKELIPVDIQTTVTGEHFRYIRFSYDTKTNSIIFEKIKNLSEDKRPVTVTIALFGDNKKCIGKINYCSTQDNNDNVELEANGETSYTINVTKKYLGDDFSLKDVKYISLITENLNCATGSATDEIGYTVEEIGQPKNTTMDDDSQLLVNILLIVGGVLLFIFVYNFMFSTKYTNMDGDELRQEYKSINKRLKLKRDYDAIHNPPPPKEVIKNKSDDVIRQEEAEKKKENQDSSDLHNFYK